MINLQRESRRIYSHVQTAFSLGLPATLTVEEWLHTIDLFHGLCAYCSVSPFEALDHMVPTHAGGGTTKQNCVPACTACNSYKIHRLGDDVSQMIDIVEAARRTFETLGKAPSSRVKTDFTKVQVRFVSDDILEGMKALAKEDNRSLNGEIMQAFREFIKQRRAGHEE